MEYGILRTDNLIPDRSVLPMYSDRIVGAFLWRFSSELRRLGLQEMDLKPCEERRIVGFHYVAKFIKLRKETLKQLTENRERGPKDWTEMYRTFVHLQARVAYTRLGFYGEFENALFRTHIWTSTHHPALGYYTIKMPRHRAPENPEEEFIEPVAKRAARLFLVGYRPDLLREDAFSHTHH